MYTFKAKVVKNTITIAINNNSSAKLFLSFIQFFNFFIMKLPPISF